MNNALVEEKLEKYNQKASPVVLNIVLILEIFTLSIPFAYLYFKLTDGNMYVDTNFFHSVSILFFSISCGVMLKSLFFKRKETDEKILENKMKGLNFYIDKNYALPTMGYFQTLLVLNLGWCYLMYSFGGAFEYMAYAMCIGYIVRYNRRISDFKKYLYLFDDVLK